MTGTSRWARVPEVLTAMEDLELPLLSWGVTEAALSRDEVESVLVDAVTADLTRGIADGPTEDEYLQYLVQEALLHQVPGTSPARYRTRLGEGLRLLSGLRQLFPPGRSPAPNWWRNGIPLVADYRLDVAPRRYPRWDLPPDDSVHLLSAGERWSELQRDVAHAVIGDRKLAQFQVTAARAVLTGLADTRSRGIVVGAGTGSGKTLAFYLPALLSLSPTLPQGATQSTGKYVVHTLALYPRKELLRDQARDAVASVLGITDALRRHGARPPRVGLLYTDTPHNARDRRIGGNGSAWRRVPDGARCPYFPCPVENCLGDLVWCDEDRQTGVERERLRCARCGMTLDDNIVALTRDALIRRPPDILFTTTEMLSRHATSDRYAALLGWRGAGTPRLVLLDEVHTYSGVHGAQVALTLRRWRNAVRTSGGPPPTFVGLSATLRDAVPFFAILTGLPEAAVEYVSPSGEDLVPSGRQYAVAVRGDPVSGASLLSTSLQAAMLMGRLLDLPDRDGLFGSSGFLFTDDLDVTNRFYDDLRDAEGGQTRYRPGVARKAVLAQLRSPRYQPAVGASPPSHAMDRYRDAQSWQLVQQIGHSLTGNPMEGALSVGRTSSQDTGVDSDADLVVATSSLEVGFNDPRVGLVLQHKAPHDAAAFIQRRGRAGRSPAMRPWTVVVLSDYGRDRAAYQGYEQLFAPELSARRLPVRNRYVLKIQAVHSLLDWLSWRASRGGRRVDAREVLRAPGSTRQPGTEQVAALLTELLSETAVRDQLARHLELALSVPADDIQAVLWEEPRSLLLSAVPTALRRLAVGWSFVDADPGACQGDLLPEHITRALFDPLNVPDVEFRFPFPVRDDDSTHMPILAALREAVPGRVSRRFGVERDEHRTWLPLPVGGSGLEVGDVVVSGQRLGRWADAGSTYEVTRPLQLRLQQPPPEVKDSTHALPVWRSAFVPGDRGPGNEAAVSQHSRWSDLVRSSWFALHITGDPLEVRRMTTGAEGEARYRDGTSRITTVKWVIDAQPAALGFSIDVDAFVVDAAALDPDDSAVIAHLHSPAWRTQAFHVRVAEDTTLDDVANSFQRGWLSLLYLTAYSIEALSCPEGADVATRLSGGRWLDDLRRMLVVLYRSASPDDLNQHSPELLLDRLRDLGHNPVVLAALERHVQVLTSLDIVASTLDLAERAYADTLAAAVRHAVLRVVPDAQDNDLVVDVTGADNPGRVRIILSETAIGGLGLIEQLRVTYTRDPRRFWSLVAAAVGPSDYEDVDRSVRRLLTDAVADQDGAIASAMSNVRTASGVLDADRALRELLQLWTQLDGPPRHLAVAALSARFLRPGATAATDRDAVRLLVAWDRMEERIGAELDSRVVAYAAALGALPGDGEPIALTADQVFSLLWPRGHQARNQQLHHWQPYRTDVLLDRRLVESVVECPVPAIDVMRADWTDHYRDALSVHESVELQAPGDRRDVLAAAVRRVGAIPVDRDALRIYGRLGRLAHHGRTLSARVTVSEAYQ